MFRQALIFGVVAASVLGRTPVLQASVQTGDVVRIGDGPGSPGGVFFLQDADGNKLSDTFCVQLEEYISFNKTYQVTNHLATSTVGVGSRPLTSFAAWLFDRYLNGVEGMGPVLSNFDFANKYGEIGIAAARFQANELQLAIWRAMGYLPEEIGGVINGGWYDTYDDKLAGWEAEFNSDLLWSGTGDVYVLNLLGKDSAGNYTVHAQDQLVRIPSPPDVGDVVPEPLSLAVWSVLAVGMLGFRQLKRAGHRAITVDSITVN